MRIETFDQLVNEAFSSGTNDDIAKFLQSMIDRHLEGVDHQYKEKLSKCKTDEERSEIRFVCAKEYFSSGMIRFINLNLAEYKRLISISKVELTVHRKLLEKQSCKLIKTVNNEEYWVRQDKSYPLKLDINVSPVRPPLILQHLSYLKIEVSEYLNIINEIQSKIDPSA